jgi:hypothetical protein
MPVTRKLLASDNNQDNQVLKMDNSNRYIVNDNKSWQFLFGPNSILDNSQQILKLAAELNTDTLNDIRITGYLFNTVTGSIDSAGTCVFNVYRVANSTNPAWDDILIATIPGTLQLNSYFYATETINNLTGANLDGDTTLMIEGVATRLNETYRDRIYVNHLGVYDSIVRLRNDVEFLDLTKVDE